MPAAAQRRMLELVPFAAARNPIDVTGEFLNDPSLLGQAIDLAATNGDYASLGNLQGSIGRNPALTEVTRASWIERERANPDKHFTVSRFCTPDYTRDLEAAGVPVYEEATRAIAALAGFAWSFRGRCPCRAVPAPASLPTGRGNELAATGAPTVPARHARTARTARKAASVARGARLGGFGLKREDGGRSAGGSLFASGPSLRQEIRKYGCPLAEIGRVFAISVDAVFAGWQGLGGRRGRSEHGTQRSARRTCEGRSQR